MHFRNRYITVDKPRIRYYTEETNNNKTVSFKRETRTEESMDGID